MNETGVFFLPAEAGCTATPDDEGALVSTGFAVLPVLVELKRIFAFSCGSMAMSTSGKSAVVKPARTNGSAAVLEVQPMGQRSSSLEGSQYDPSHVVSHPVTNTTVPSVLTFAEAEESVS